MDHESVAQNHTSERMIFFFFCPDSKYLMWEEKKLLEFVRAKDSMVFFFFPLF